MPSASTNQRETIPAGGAFLRSRVANQAVVAAVAAHVGRDRLENIQHTSSGTPSVSKLTESLKRVTTGTNSNDQSPDILQPPNFHQRTGSMHAHFYVEDTLKHPRSRSTSASTADGKGILESLQNQQIVSGPTSGISSGGLVPAGSAPLSAPVTAANLNTRLPHDDGKLHVLFGACGSISIKKTRLIINKLEEIYKDKISIQLILTKAAEHFVSRGEFPSNVQLWKDKDEWTTWNARSDPVLLWVFVIIF
ncbi:unnamed protein product [Ambrosiozyma monospora]|uniref:Unnamed protein product n=1 Tax=Ambrosiozyma monospora TaxID=43982 RepID=A0ACB5U051_AMBMO|nr:unnamed protein product [Ambrosiozyma monospora]